MLYVPSYMSAAEGRNLNSDEQQTATSLVSPHQHTKNKTNINDQTQISHLDSESLIKMKPRDRLNYLQQQTQSSMYHRNLRYIQQQRSQKSPSETAGQRQPSPPLVLQNLAADSLLYGLNSIPEHVTSNGPISPSTSKESSEEPIGSTPWILRRSVRFRHHHQPHQSTENRFSPSKKFESEPLLYESNLSGETDEYKYPFLSSNESIVSMTPAIITKNPVSPSIYEDYFAETLDNSDGRVMLKRSSSRRLVRRKIASNSLKRVVSLKFLSKNQFESKLEYADEFSVSSGLSFRAEMRPDEASECDSTQRVTLNISGMKYETWMDILSQHPNTLLGNPKKRQKYYDAKRREYFFDRHRPTFESIFNYYQYGGKLKRPHHVPDDIFLEELRFYEIEQEIIAIYRKGEGYVDDKIVLPEEWHKQIIWKLFEIPHSSKLAYLFAIISVVFTIISIILFCLETLPENKNSHCVGNTEPNFNDTFFILETICTAWFTLEVIFRLYSCPSKLDYVKDVKNYVDFAAILPYYVTLINVLTYNTCEGAKSSGSLSFLRAIRLIRVFKLTKHSPGLQILILTFKASLEGLGLFLVALIVCILLFSSTIYYAELNNYSNQSNESSAMTTNCKKIESIPDAFWWAVITMCTVGYGDIVPVGLLGKLIGSVCAVAGVLTLAIPVPIITENFNKFYAHNTGRNRI